MICLDELSINPRYNQQIKKIMVFNALGVHQKRENLIARLNQYNSTGRIESYRVEYDIVSNIGIHFSQQSPAVPWNEEFNEGINTLLTGPHRMENFISVWSENSRNPAQMKQFYSQYREVPCQN